MTIEGVTPAIADEIIKWRPYASMDHAKELLGEKVFEMIKRKVNLGPRPLLKIAK